MSDWTKLPKWAQSERDRLQREVASLREQLETLAATAGDTRTCDLKPGVYYYDHSGMGLPVARSVPSERITFVMEGGIVVEAHAGRTVKRARKAPGWEDVHGLSVRTNSGPMRILPEASNAILVTEEGS